MGYEPDTDIWRRSATVDAIFGFAPEKEVPSAAPSSPGCIPTICRRSFEPCRVRFKALTRQCSTSTTGRRSRDRTIRYTSRLGRGPSDVNGKPRLIGVMMDVSTDRLREAALSDALRPGEPARAEGRAARRGETPVKNSLQLVVSALSYRHGVDRSLDEGSLEQAISRVRAITSVHERLYRTDNPLVVEMGDYLASRGLCAISPRTRNSGSSFMLDVEPLLLKTERRSRSPSSLTSL